MNLSLLLSRHGVSIAGLLGYCAVACGDERDVTRVLSAELSSDIVAATPEGGSAEPPVETAQPVETPDAGSVTGACGLGRRATYAFSSRFVPDASSVDYSAAVLRHVLISELGAFAESVTARFESGQRLAEGELLAAAGTWLESPTGASDGLELSLALPGDPALVERSRGDLSSEGALFAVIAGSDPASDHRPWTEPRVFVGFEDLALGRGGRSSFSPRELVVACLEQIEVNARNRAIGLLQTDPAREVLPLHLTGDGRDLAQLIRSFLLGAVAFSRGVDAELDDDVPGSGLLAASEASGGAPYSALEHAWDMAFGYFGAARDYDRGDAARSASDGAWFDTNADCAISLESEVNFGAALAARTAEHGAEDFGRRAFDAFVAGRRWLAAAPQGGATDPAAPLRELRDRAAEAWESALAASSVRALNRLSFQVDQALASSVEYSFGEQARSWSELKGTSLAFQFHRRSALPAADFAELHRRIGDAPRVPDTLPPTNGAELRLYLEDLRRARDILQATYGFDAASIDAW